MNVGWQRSEHRHWSDDYSSLVLCMLNLFRGAGIPSQQVEADCSWPLRSCEVATLDFYHEGCIVLLSPPPPPNRVGAPCSRPPKHHASHQCLFVLIQDGWAASSVLVRCWMPPDTGKRYAVMYWPASPESPSQAAGDEVRRVRLSSALSLAVNDLSGIICKV